MTREDAIEMLKKDKQQRGDCFISMALDMAIKALEQELCEDAVIRREVLDELRTCFDTHSIYDENNGENYIIYEDAVDMMEKLPPVTPTRKVGKWIRKPIRNDKGGCVGAEMICTCCGKDNECDKKFKLCPNCGAEMKGVEDDSN